MWVELLGRGPGIFGFHGSLFDLDLCVCFKEECYSGVRTLPLLFFSARLLPIK